MPAGTWNLPKIRKTVPYRGIKDISTIDIFDTTATSPNYFNVIDFPDRLTSGKNLIKLNAANETLVDDSQIPSDKTFRNAWVKGSGVVTEDVTKAKVIAHKIRREKRELEFEPYDNIISLNIPGQDSDAAETARASIRTKYATMQTNINNASDIAGIKTALGG